MSSYTPEPAEPLQGSRKQIRNVLFLFLVPFILMNCNPKTNEEEKIIGVKIYDHQGSMGELFNQWNDLGINTAFSSMELLSNGEYRRLADEHHISTFAIFPVFFNPDQLANEPHIYAITAEGKQAKEEWVEFVCPSRSDYRTQMVQNARAIIRKYNPDGISIDFIRHFVFWEKVYPDRDPASLPETCFDSSCMVQFQAKTGIIIPESLCKTPEKSSWILENHLEEWRSWRCSLITSMVQEIADAVREIKPNILVNVHLVPWASGDYDGALERVAGQDIPSLALIADYLSPMTYAHMVKREPAWIHALVDEIYMRTGSKILPSIQVNKAYLERELGMEEFEQSLSEALKPPSRGVLFWSWERLVQDPEKLKVLKDIKENE